MLKKNYDTAIIFWSEDKIREKMSWLELKSQVSAVANFLKTKGIKVVIGWQLICQTFQKLLL